MKIKWEISPKPTGRYASFSYRSWPMGHHITGETAIQISSATSYSKTVADSGNHDPLVVSIADHSSPQWRWRKLKGTFATLAEAKAAGIDILMKNPAFMPKATP